MKKYLLLFFTMLKVGLFTFGGGYAMIPLIENEFVTKKKWLDHDEFINMITIAESTPGPIAVNTSTYIGYKLGNVLGALICTLGVCLPSFVIIFLISLFFNEFLSILWVAAAFKGIQICVIFLILSAGLKFLKILEKNFLNISIFVITLTCMILFSLFSVNFSSIFYILASGLIGLIIFTINSAKKHTRREDKE